MASAIHAQESAPLRFCLESVNLPMAMPHPDRGIEVELARAVATQLGREAVFVWRAPGGETADRALVAGECDVAPGAVTDPAPLARGGAGPGVALTRPYAATGYLLIRRSDAAPARRLADIGDLRIGVETESVAIYTLKQRGHRVHALDDYDAVIRAVAAGRISYGYLWGPLAAWLIRDRDDVLLVDDFETEDRWNFSLAVRAGDTALEAELDQALGSMLESGAVADIFAEYGVPYVRPQVDASQRETEAIPITGITVTVLRMPMEIARAPFAVAVNGGDDIQRARPGLGLDEALRGIPGVQVDNRYNYALGERISIRGFGARSQFGVRGIRVLVDGIPATFPDGQTSLSHVDLGLLSRAEVVRGPASTLYGNTAGGVVQLETESAPADGLAQELGVMFGADGLLKLNGGSGGRSGSLDYLVNLSRLEYGGFREFSSAENLRLNAKLGWSGERDDLRVTASAVEYDARNPGSLNAELLAEDRSQAYRFNLAQRTGEEGRQAQLGAVWRRATGAGELELAAYGISRTVTNPIPIAVIQLDRSVGGIRALFRSDASLVRGVQWTAGVDADVQIDDRQNHGNTGGERAELSLDQRERVTNLAGFGQLAAPLTRRLTVLAGLRYDGFRFTADDRLITETNPDDSGERLMDAVSPSVGASFIFGRALTVYGNIATAFETPTTTELTNRPTGEGGFNPDLEPQEAVSVEVGGRGQAGGWLAYDAALYRAEVRNALIAFQVPGAEGRDFFRNAGSTVHRGLELSATAAAPLGMRVQAAYSYTDARFDEYSADDEVLDGNRVPGIAPHRLELIGTYEAPNGLFVGLENRYVAEMPVDDANAFSSPSYNVTDLRVGAERVRVGPMELAPFVGVSNVFDREYNTSVTVNAFGRRYYEPGPGRAIYGGATVRFRQ